jgi:hypothetical protein
MMRAGVMTASRHPNRVLRAIICGEVLTAAVQLVTTPQRMMFAPRTFETLNLWRSMPKIVSVKKISLTRKSYLEAVLRLHSQ